MKRSETEVSKMKRRYIRDIFKAISQIDNLWVLGEIYRFVANITR